MRGTVYVMKAAGEFIGQTMTYNQAGNCAAGRVHSPTAVNSHNVLSFRGGNQCNFRYEN